MIAPVYVSAAVVVVLCGVIGVAVRAAVREHVATRSVRAISQRRLDRMWIADGSQSMAPRPPRVELSCCGARSRAVGRATPSGGGGRLSGDYRIALRTQASGGGRGDGPTSEPLDDVVVNGVACFRLEDMGDWVWACCYLDHSDERITFSIRRGRRGEPPIVVIATELPDVAYEGGGR